MLRTLIIGAIAAIAGTKLKKAYDDGRLDPLIDRTKTAYKDAKRRAADGGQTPRSSAPAPSTARSAQPGGPDSPSRPAKAAPWPVDPQAISRS
ncbi:MAG TPA: hypothetical protein VFF84_05290 [Sphingobium sp.]|nr:hypothetical protein [Sphingobium sp.]